VKKMLSFFLVFFVSHLSLVAILALLGAPIWPRTDIFDGHEATVALKTGKNLDVLVLSTNRDFGSGRPTDIRVNARWQDGTQVPNRPINYNAEIEDRRGRFTGHAFLRLTPDRGGLVRLTVVAEPLVGIRIATQEPIEAAFITLGIITGVAAAIATWVVYWRTRTKPLQ
jgi:hypothetical protein